MDELPEIIPLFPLPNVVLFPDVELPLHVFEARYREMVDAALASDRVIGMTLLRGDWRRHYLGSPEIFPLGCAGRIERFEMLPDGRSNLVLQGLAAFDVREEIPGRSFRQARVGWRPNVPVKDACELEEASARLRAGVTRLLQRGDRAFGEDLWTRLPRESDKLVHALAFGLDLAAIEKLSVLDCPDALSRTERLVEILEFRLAEQGIRGSGEREEEPWH